MKKSIIYILFALFSFSAAVSLTACKDDGVEISDAYKSKTPKNVKLLEYGNKSLTICWDFVRGATSYTVQLVDGDMNPVSEALCMTTADIDYHEFTDLPTDRIYYGRVRANYPYSATSDWVYVTEHDKPAMLMASVGILDLDPQLKLHAASGSTLTFEWSYTDDKATDAESITRCRSLCGAPFSSSIRRTAAKSDRSAAVPNGVPAAVPTAREALICSAARSASTSLVSVRRAWAMRS